MIQNDIALSRVEIDQARLITLQAARCIDTMGTKRSRKQVGYQETIVNWSVKPKKTTFAASFSGPYSTRKGRRSQVFPLTRKIVQR